MSPMDHRPKPPKVKPVSPGPRGAINHEIDLDSIMQEEWYVNLLSVLAKPKFKFDSSVITELKQMAAQHTQGYRDGTPRLPTVRDRQDIVVLQEENAKCLADRDRVTDILVSSTDIKFGIDKLWEHSASKLLENESYRKLTNDAARNAFLNAVLEPLHAKRSQIRKTIALCEILQEHLSHTHFTIKQHVEMSVAFLNFKSA